MSIEDLILSSIQSCLSQGIAIEPGACFDWTGPDYFAKPRAVNWAGAVLLANKDKIKDFSFGSLLSLLSVDRSWSYRFMIGFDQGRVLSILDAKSLKEIRKDDVSMLGFDVRKVFVEKG
jgi:hypothetical protein